MLAARTVLFSISDSDMAKEAIQSRQERVFSKTYAVVFMFLLGLPLLSLPFFTDSERTSEKRTPVAFPSLSSDYGEFSRAFEAWFEDHFGFRAAMIRFYRQSRFELGLLDSMNNVVRGKEDWLYYSGGGGGDSVQAYAGANAFSENELGRLHLYFETWGAWLEGQGITFLVLVGPDKVSVYPEFLPNRIEKSPYGTRVEDFLVRMSESDFSIVFPIDELIEAKIGGSQLYYKLDTHWNAKGMFVAYDALAEKLPKSNRLSVNDVQFVGSDRLGGDLAEMLGVESDWGDPTYSVVLNRGNWAINEGDREVLGKTVDRFSIDDSTLPKALVFHDSFMEPMKNLLAGHFRETNFLADKPLDSALVLELQPDVVIVEFTERSLYTHLRKPLPIGEGGQ